MTWQENSDGQLVWIEQWNLDDELAYTGDDTWPEKYAKWHAVYTIQLGELIEEGLFDWSSELLDWSDVAYDEAQYTRVCEYFNARFKWREISLEPYLEWATILHTKLVYELMPKFKPLYERVEQGIAPLADSDEYYKERRIESAYPETMLSGNSDYASDGQDIEWERIRESDQIARINDYAANFHSVDELLLNELECMFVCMYSSHINGL